jgi:hypothetical protein
MGATQGIAGVFGQGKPAPTLVTFTFLSKASYGMATPGVNFTVNLELRILKLITHPHLECH